MNGNPFVHRIKTYALPFIALVWAVYQISVSVVPALSPVENQAVHLGFALVFLYLSSLKEDSKSVKTSTTNVLNIVLALVSLAAVAYVLMDYHRLTLKVGDPNYWDTVVGAVLILTALEGTRRAFGAPLSILTGAMILYAYFGPYMPGFFFHGGFDVRRLIATLSTNFTGVFSAVLDASATFIVLFMIFGGLLQSFGGGDFFIKLALAVAGRFKSGPGQAAVISSLLVGSINGSAVANVVTTGVFTIPMMKNRGYKSHFAGAVEATASTGGMLMPPIMGIGAFIMSAITGINYFTIALSALIPALLYYFSVAITVHLRAVRRDLQPLKADQIPAVKEVLREGGHFLLPVFVIAYSMARGYSVMRAGILGIAVLLGAVIIRETIRNRGFLISKDFRTKLMGSFTLAAQNAMGVAAATATMGVIAHAAVITGLTDKIMFLVVGTATPIIAVLLTILISIFFGMGVPTTASYLIVAVLGAPALVQMGFPLIGVHLFIYYYAILANITPPVGAAALVASRVAESKYLPTALTAVRVALPGFVLPLLFIYHPTLIGIGTPFGIIRDTLSALVGIVALSVFFEGHLFAKVNWLFRLGMAAGSLMLIIPGLATDLIGYALVIAVVLSNLMQSRRMTVVASA